MKANSDIRNALDCAGMKQWELAKALGVGESTLVRHLRDELPQEEKNSLLEVIQKNSKKRGE